MLLCAPHVQSDLGCGTSHMLVSPVYLTDDVAELIPLSTTFWILE